MSSNVDNQCSELKVLVNLVIDVLLPLSLSRDYSEIFSEKVLYNTIIPLFQTYINSGCNKQDENKIVEYLKGLTQTDNWASQIEINSTQQYIEEKMGIKLILLNSISDNDKKDIIGSLTTCNKNIYLLNTNYNHYNWLEKNNTNGYKQTDVSGDGNCFYYALYNALKQYFNLCDQTEVQKFNQDYPNQNDFNSKWRNLIANSEEFQIFVTDMLITLCEKNKVLIQDIMNQYYCYEKEHDKNDKNDTMINHDISTLDTEINNIKTQITKIPDRKYKNYILVGFNKLIKEFNGFKKKYGYAFGATSGDASDATPGDASDATPIVTSDFSSGAPGSGSGARSSPTSILKKGSTKQKQFNYEVENKQITIPNTLVIYLTTNVPGFQKIKFVPYMVQPKLNKYVDTVYFDPMIPLNTFVIQKTPRELVELQFFDKGLFLSLKNRILTEKWFSTSDLTSKILSNMFSNPETVNKNTSVTTTRLQLGATLPYFQNPDNVNIMRGLVNRGNTFGAFLNETFTMGMEGLVNRGNTLRAILNERLMGYFMGNTGATSSITGNTGTTGNTSITGITVITGGSVYRGGSVEDIHESRPLGAFFNETFTMGTRGLVNRGNTGATGATGNTGPTGAPIIGGSVYRGGSVEDIHESRPLENVKVEKTLEQQLEDAKNNGTIDHNIRTTINVLFKENSVIYLNNKPYTIYACKTTPGDWKIDTNTNLPAFLSTGEYYGPYSGNQDRLLSQGPYSRYPMDRFRQPTFYITNNTANTSSPLQVQTGEKQLSTIPKKLLTGTTYNEKEFSIIPTIHSVEWKYENKPKTSVPIPVEYKNVGEILEKNRFNPNIRSILPSKFDKNDQYFIDYKKNHEKNDRLRIGNGSSPIVTSNKSIENGSPNRSNKKSIQNGPKANNVKRVTLYGGSKNNIIPVNPYYNTSTNFNIFLQHGGGGATTNIKKFFGDWYGITNVLYQNMSDNEKKYYYDIQLTNDENNDYEITTLTLNDKNKDNSYFISIAQGINNFNDNNSNPIVGLDDIGKEDERIKPLLLGININMDNLKLAIYHYLNDHQNEYKKYIDDNKIQNICDTMNKEFQNFIYKTGSFVIPSDEVSYNKEIKKVYEKNNIINQYFGIKTPTFDEYSKYTYGDTQKNPFQIVKKIELKNYIQSTDFMIADIIDIIIQKKYGIKVIIIQKKANNTYDVINCGNIISEETKNTPWSKYMFLLLDNGIYYLMSFNNTSIFLKENETTINLKPPIYIILLLYIDCFINGLYKYGENNKSKSKQEVYNEFIKNVHLFKTDFEIFIKTTKTIYNIVSKYTKYINTNTIDTIKKTYIEQFDTCYKNKILIDDLFEDIENVYKHKISRENYRKNMELLEETINKVNKLVEVVDLSKKDDLLEKLTIMNTLKEKYNNSKGRNYKMDDNNGKTFYFSDLIVTDTNENDTNENFIFNLLTLIENTNFDNEIKKNAVNIRDQFMSDLIKISKEYNENYNFMSDLIKISKKYKKNYNVFGDDKHKQAIIEYITNDCRDKKIDNNIIKNIQGIEGIEGSCKEIDNLANNIINKYKESVECMDELTIQIENIEFYEWLDGYIKEITEGKFNIRKLFTIVDAVDIKVDDDILFGPVYGPPLPPSPTPVTTGLKKIITLPDTPPPDIPPPPLDELDILNDQLKREIINAWQEVSYDKDPSKKYWWNKITNETTSIGASKPTGMTSATPTPTFMSYDSQLKENSKISFVVFVNLVLYPGTSIPASERKKLACYMNYEEMRRSYAELMGYEYIPKPMNDPSYYKLNNDNKSILKTNTNTNTNTRYQPGQRRGQQLPRQTSLQNTRRRVSFDPNPPQRFRGGKNKTKRNKHRQK